MTAFNSPAQGNEEQILRALEAIFGVGMTMN